MPQMAPMLWMPLFILFSTLLMISMVNIYPNTKNSNNQNLNFNQSNNKSMNWKW